MAARGSFFKRLLGKKEPAQPENAIWESVSDVATVAPDQGDIHRPDPEAPPARAASPQPVSQPVSQSASQVPPRQVSQVPLRRDGQSDSERPLEGLSEPRGVSWSDSLRQPEGDPASDAAHRPITSKSEFGGIDAEVTATGAKVTPLEVPPPPFPDAPLIEDIVDPGAVIAETPAPDSGLSETELPETELPATGVPEMVMADLSRPESEPAQTGTLTPEFVSEASDPEAAEEVLELASTTAPPPPEAVTPPDTKSVHEASSSEAIAEEAGGGQPEIEAGDIAAGSDKQLTSDDDPIANPVADSSARMEAVSAPEDAAAITADALAEALGGETASVHADRGSTIKPLPDDMIPEPVIPLIGKIPEDEGANALLIAEKKRSKEAEEKPASKPGRGLFARLSAGLAKSSNRLSQGVSDIFMRKKLDDETLEALEDLLIAADLGVGIAQRLTSKLAKSKFDKQVTGDEIRLALAAEIETALTDHASPLTLPPKDAHNPVVILMAGVNGAGKTTTLAKLGKRYIEAGKSVMLVAGDTFRAAAIEQLSVWGARMGAEVMAREPGADAAGLAYDALKKAREDKIDIVLVDTAGRLQNKTELMDELSKIIRVIRKIDDTAPHHRILVLDATVGQNALSQTSAFHEVADVTGLIMTKLDGTAKGGILVSLADKFALPIHYVGVGENIDDLQRFEARSFARALTGVDD